MTQQDMINAITTALQTADANGEFNSVIIILQALLLINVQTMSIDKLQQICSILNINTGAS
jgi:hypothetical protein